MVYPVVVNLVFLSQGNIMKKLLLLSFSLIAIFSFSKLYSNTLTPCFDDLRRAKYFQNDINYAYHGGDIPIMVTKMRKWWGLWPTLVSQVMMDLSEIL